MNSNSSRRDLGFIRAVTEHFEFLVTDYGYVLTECSDTVVRYRSDLMHVSIYHERLSYEIEFRIGCVDSPGRIDLRSNATYGLHEIFKAMIPGYEGEGFYQSSNRSGVAECISYIAANLKEHCADLLMGSAEAIRRVKMMRGKLARETTYQYTIAPTKNKAQGAWERKDYEEVIRLYKSIETELTALEGKRLDFACKRIGEN